ncbi:hypothetical protein BN2475_90172 [Paraburkholderia ribeironis]|uniref:Uncharacterized protein n=1 Tax=Paraburkholderia ribeironis TaxID=1247936 RepID=A0A1N7RNK3_9BURK|nr:hypothetical protein BN2475_90172 [Paraburkholderia ribeironis]
MMIDPQLSNWCIAIYLYWCHIIMGQKKTAYTMPFPCSPLMQNALLGMRRLTHLARPPARQRRNTPVGRPRRPFPVRVAAQNPAFQRRLLKLAGFAFVERLLAQFTVRPLSLERRIAERPVQRMVGDQAVERQADVMTVARPAIVFRRADQLRAHRTHLDDAARQQEVALAFDHRGPVAAFPQRAAARVAPIEMRHIATPHRLHRFRQARLLGWRDEQLHGARHQRIRVNRQVMIARSRLQAVNEEFVVLVVDEGGLLIEPAKDDVLRLVRDIKTCKPCHAEVSDSRVGTYPKVRRAACAGGSARRGQARNRAALREKALTTAYGLFQTFSS